MIKYEVDPYSSLLLRPEPSTRTVLLREVSPLDYTLQEADFHVFVKGSDQSADYCLDYATGTGMAWALKRLIRYLFRAARVQMISDPSLPAGVYPYIPPHMFELLGLSPPSILALAHMDTVNMLSMLAPRATIEALWRDFQAIGHDAIAWVDMARERCREKGSSFGWDWDRTNVTGSVDFEMAEQDDINDASNEDPVTTTTVYYTFPTRELSPITLTSQSDYSMSDDEVDHIFNDCRDVVLHPQLSRITTLKPSYNVFGGQDLVDNNDDLLIMGQY